MVKLLEPYASKTLNTEETTQIACFCAPSSALRGILQ